MEALLLGALLVLAGCIEPTGGKSTVQPTAGLVAAEKDVVLKEAALVQPETRQVLGFDSSTGEITVAGDVAVKAGQVFHSGVTDVFPSGALKKVLAVETLQESKKVLITEDAVLTDGIENGEYSAEGRLFLDGMRVESPDGSLTMVDSPETAALLGNGENSSLTRRFDVKYSIGNNVSVTGSFQLTLPISFMLDIKSSELKAFDISIEPKLDLDLDIRGSLNDRHTHRLGTLYLQPVTIGVVVISPVLEVSLSTAIDGVTEFGFQAKSEFLAGARYSGTTGRWIPYSDNNIDVEIEPPSLAGAVEASLGLKKELRLYGVAGPYFTPEIYAGLRGKSDGSKVSFSAYRGLRARAEGEVKRLGKNLPDLNFTLFDVRDDLELSNKTNMLPIAGFSYTKEETSPGVYRVNFSDGSTDEDGSIVSREWDFDGDGNTDSTDRNPSRTFSNVDTAVVKLTVRDNRMGSKSISRRLIPLAAYTVSFDANGGSSVSGQSVPEGGRAAEPDAPTRSGYVFRGWYSDSDLTRPWDFGGDTVNSSLTLYAKWEEQEEIETLDESFEGGSLSPFWIGSWIIDSKAYSGSGSLKSNDIDNSQSAAAEVRVRVSLASEISFYRKVSSEDGYDKLSFYINGEQPPGASWSGSKDWAEMSYPIAPGAHTLKWVYEKDDSYSDDSDCAWIDDVSMKRGAINGLSPANGESTADTTPTFSWNTVTGADRYEIQIADSPEGLNNAAADSVTGTNYTPETALTNNTTHYWRVRAVDGKNQEGDWSTAHSLNVAIGAVSGLSPADGESTADTTPTFSWNTVTGADRYEIQIADSPEGLTNAAADSVTGTNYTPETALTNNTTHYWRVRALDSGGQAGSWNDAYSLMLPDGFVYVEGGSFQMGSTGGNPDEKPVHQVTVSTFYMSKYEVTQGEWHEVMRSSPSHFSGDNLPVEQVSWYDAVKYCNALSVQNGLTPVYTINGTSVTADWSANGYRLPTEAEWEYAARGGNASEGYIYAGGNNAGEVAWYLDNSGNETHPVGQKNSNELGLYDMSGNVREWCWDWYGGDYYESSPSSDPRGPASGSYRVNRGGRWGNGAGYLRSAFRYSDSPGISNALLGFRLVRRGF